MATQVISDPMLLDSTGQDIVTGLAGIASAVQPINIYLDINISIPVDGWSETVPYRYTWTNVRVTEECGIEVYFADGAETVDMKYLEYEKVPGGIRFEIDAIPDKAIPLIVRIINASTTAVIDPVEATLVTTEAVPGTSNVEEALANHEGRISTNEASISDLEDDVDDINGELAIRLKSVNSIPADENGNVDVVETEYARQIVTDDAQQSTGEFLFRTTGGDASLSDGPAMLVSIGGRSVHTGVVQESLNMTVNMATREEGQEGITAEIDRDTFVSYVSVSGTTTLTFTTEWSADPEDYGITVTGTPISGDNIVVVYVKESRGTITVSNPNKFISTGWNLYNNENGKKYAHVKKYSTTYGFKIGGAYSSLEFSETVSGARTSITPASGYFTVPADGYVFVTGGDATTYIFMTWSDWTEGYEGEFEAYTESAIDLSTIMANFSNGLFQVGYTYDEINFSMKRAISRIERLAYTDGNIEYARNSGRAYDADENYIYLVKETEDVYVITSTGAYTASDHGNEIIEGGEVPVYVSTLYGQNLVDKLRTDVVTKSQDIVNNLTDGGTTKALSAEMGKELNSNISTLSNIITTKSITTGITGVTARKTGNVVMLKVIATSPTSKGWFAIGYLPESLRPTYDFYTTIPLVNTDNSIALLQITASTGYTKVYNPNTTENSVNGAIMYVTES